MISSIHAPRGRVNGEIADVDFARRKLKTENRYRNADRSRFSNDLVGTNEQGSSADWHYKEEQRFYRGIELARALDRDDMVAGHGIDQFCTNVLQGGFLFDPMTGNDGIDAYIKEVKWLEFAADKDQVDYQRERTFDELSWSIFRSHVVDGDQLVVPQQTGEFQTLEAHLLRTPYGRIRGAGTTPLNFDGERRRRTIHGVEINDFRQRQNYFFAQDDVKLWETLRFNDYSQIPARDAEGFANVLHPRLVRRGSSQTRGVSIFNPIISACGMLDDIQFAKLVQQQTVSVWALLLEREIGGEYPEGQITSRRGTSQAFDSQGNLVPIDDIAAGMAYTGHPGERLKGFSPNVPNPTYIDHAKQIMEIIAVNLGLPYVVLMMDASQTNFSGWRGAVDQAKLIWQRFQKRFKEQWYREAFWFKMRQWATEGSPFYDPFLGRALRNGINVFSHDWITPTWPYVNPIEDITANAMEVSKAQNSPRRVQARNGRDYQQVIVGEMIDDNFDLIDRAMEKAEELEAKHPGQKVTWEQIVSVSTPDNVNRNVSESITNEEESGSLLEDEESQQPVG